MEKEKQKDFRWPVDTVDKLSNMMTKQPFSKKLLADLLEVCVNETHSDVGHIYTFDKEKNNLMPYITFHKNPKEKMRNNLIKIGKAIESFSITSLSPLIINDTSDFRDRLAPSDKKSQSIICIPIISQRSGLGVLSLSSKEKNNYTEFHHAVLSFLSGIIAFYMGYIPKNKAVPETIQDVLKSNTDFAFVIMPFKEPFNKYYHSIIKPAVSDVGLFPLRADEIYRPTEILKDIYGLIKRSKVIIAELTGRNPNVLYELGYSHALNKPTILVTQTMDDVPFDLMGLRCITYDTTDPDWSAKLKDTLKEYLKAAFV